jgi:hypothetical protein
LLILALGALNWLFGLAAFFHIEEHSLIFSASSAFSAFLIELRNAETQRTRRDSNGLGVAIAPALGYS